MSAQRDEVVEPRDPIPELFIEEAKEQRDRCMPGAVGDQHEHAFSIDREPCTFGGQQLPSRFICQQLSGGTLPVHVQMDLPAYCGAGAGVAVVAARVARRSAISRTISRNLVSVSG
jgi:hypothetical protein